MNENAVIQFEATNVTIAQHPHGTVMTIIVPDNIAGRMVALMNNASPVVTVSVTDYSTMFEPEVVELTADEVLMLDRLTHNPKICEMPHTAKYLIGLAEKGLATVTTTEFGQSFYQASDKAKNVKVKTLPYEPAPSPVDAPEPSEAAPMRERKPLEWRKENELRYVANVGQYQFAIISEDGEYTLVIDKRGFAVHLAKVNSITDGKFCAYEWLQGLVNA